MRGLSVGLAVFRRGVSTCVAVALPLLACEPALPCGDPLGSAGNPEDPAPPGFYAYYTRLPTVEDEPGTVTNAIADVVVNVSDRGGQLVFARDRSFRPVWRTSTGDTPVPHLAPIAADGPTEERFDLDNRYAYARVVATADQTVEVEWRYYPDFSNLGPSGVVYEHFTISSDGAVHRTHRAGTERIDAWRDPLGETVQTFTLTPGGLEGLQTQGAMSSPPAPPLAGSPTLGPPVAEPVVAFNFDEGAGEVAVDSISGQAFEIRGHGSLWKRGVSGTAVGFDGYASKVEVDPLHLPPLDENLTLEAWVAPGAYPWNVAPIVHASAEFGTRGVFLGLDEHGAVVFTVDDRHVTSPQPVPLDRWSHVAGVRRDGFLELFVDGRSVAMAEAAAPTAGTEPLSLAIGLNTEAIAATDAVRWDDEDEFHHFSSVIGFEGLIDEVRLYPAALSPEQIAASQEAFGPGEEIAASPDLQPRALPGLASEGFGATHTRLDFHELWDDMWRVSDNADLVVGFDTMPVHYVYWRGTVHGFNMVNDAGHWMADQSVELEVPDVDGTPIVTLAEHMSDKAALRSHVRLIENTEARVVVHWRYSVVDVFDNVLDRRAFTDEIHTIYPDGVAIRHVYFHASDNGCGREGYHDLQLLLEKGQRAEDIIDAHAVSVSDMNGRVAQVVWPQQLGVEIPGNIALIRTKSEYRPFAIAQGGLFVPWSGGDEVSPHVDFEGGPFPFGGPWNHWPVGQIPSDGRFVTGQDRTASFALGPLEPDGYGTGSLLYGFADTDDPASLVPLAKSWMSPPALEVVKGAHFDRYNKDQRAYELSVEGAELELRLDGSKDRPIVNPAVVLRGWSSTEADVRVDGAQVSGVAQGVIRGVDGQPGLVVWLPVEATSSTTISVTRR